MKKDDWTKMEVDRLNSMINETELVAGVDEVGRGPLAGPLVTCAIIMAKGDRIEGIKDSKKLSEKKREELFYKIIDSALALSVSYVESPEIDQINIRQATLIAMKRSVMGLSDKSGLAVKPDLVIVDAEQIDIPYKSISLPKADDRVYSVSCASIVAKVLRDSYMSYYHSLYPLYSFKSNKGYGTAAHREAIRLYGLLPIHRRTFIHGKDLFINEQKPEKPLRPISSFFPEFKDLRQSS